MVIDGGSVTELKGQGQKVLHSPRHAPILLIYHEGSVYAVDNRCPHMGFPLDRGSVDEGILTCHWHHARFCLKSGGTFDPFADDLRTYPVQIEGDQIRVHLGEPTDLRAYWSKRLQDGLHHGLNLVIAKAVTALVDLNVDVKEIARIGAWFGCLNRRSWSPGLTILTAMANLVPQLPREDRILALYQGFVHVSRDTRGRPPRFSLGPLSNGTGVQGAGVSETQSTLDRHLTWFRHFVDVRDEDAAERTLLTAIHQGASPEMLVDMLLAAATDHVYLDVGHVVDFINKACEMLDIIGWSEADWVLPTVVPLLCQAQRSEELASWRRPIDLIEILENAAAKLDAPGIVNGNSAADGNGTSAVDGNGDLAGNVAGNSNRNWDKDVKALSDQFLSDDPQAAVDALLAAYEAGATPEQLGRALALAAAQRVVHFHVQNEFTDWDAVHHTFTYANALHQLLRRSSSRLALRGLIHGVLRVYLDRFLNVPKARIRESWVTEEQAVLQGGRRYASRLESLLNEAGNVDRAAALTIAAYDDAQAASESAFRDMYAALVRAVVREDADFHTLQMVEAAWRQWSVSTAEDPESRDCLFPLLAASRYIAAHSPTHRQLLQTAQVAMRLQAGEALHEE